MPRKCVVPDQRRYCCTGSGRNRYGAPAAPRRLPLLRWSQDLADSRLGTSGNKASRRNVFDPDSRSIRQAPLHPASLSSEVSQRNGSNGTVSDDTEDPVLEKIRMRRLSSSSTATTAGVESRP